MSILADNSIRRGLQFRNLADILEDVESRDCFVVLEDPRDSLRLMGYAFLRHIELIHFNLAEGDGRAVLTDNGRKVYDTLLNEGVYSMSEMSTEYDYDLYDDLGSEDCKGEEPPIDYPPYRD